MSGRFDSALNTLEKVAEDLAGVALKAIGERDDLSECLDAQLEIAQTWAAVASEYVVDAEQLRARGVELEAELEHVRGIVFDVDLRDAIHTLLKSEMTAGELRRALGELVR